MPLYKDWVRKDGSNLWTTGAQDFTSATSLIVPASAGYAPTADGSLGYDTTQDAWSVGGAGGVNGKLLRVLSVSRPGGALTNSTAADQDFASIYTIPANLLIANKALRITLTFSCATGTSSVTWGYYMKLGSTKVYTMGSAFNAADGNTRAITIIYQLVGTAAAGASVAVEASGVFGINALANAGGNSIAQPVAGLATNGQLTIVPGMTFSGTGSTETATLLSAVVEELN